MSEWLKEHAWKTLRLRVLTHTKTHHHTPDQQLPATTLCFSVSP
jgi:hypothetical protein